MTPEDEMRFSTLTGEVATAQALAEEALQETKSLREAVRVLARQMIGGHPVLEADALLAAVGGTSSDAPVGGAA